MSISHLLHDHTLWNLLIRFLINTLVLYVIIAKVYYRFSKKEEYLFFYSLTGIMIFLICSILGSVDMQIGLALGLFAIFAIIRFRTVAFSVKDMTYMFTIIGISIINSQANIPPPVVGALIVNASIILLTYTLEKFLQRKVLEKRSVTIKKLELLRPENKAELLRELSILTGQNIIKVNIERMDFDRKRADLEVFFREERYRYDNPEEIDGKHNVFHEELKPEPEKKKIVNDN
ncbi:MAG: DUF4956 domain-containing protein [Methanosarcina sp.]